MIVVILILFERFTMSNASLGDVFRIIELLDIVTNFVRQKYSYNMLYSYGCISIF